jgi:hypothetical protein
VRRPDRVLIAAMIRQAVIDAKSTSRFVPLRDKRSARRFVMSESFVDFCEWLGVRPSAIRETVELVREKEEGAR